MCSFCTICTSNSILFFLFLHQLFHLPLLLAAVTDEPRSLLADRSIISDLFVLHLEQFDVLCAIEKLSLTGGNSPVDAPLSKFLLILVVVHADVVEELDLLTELLAVEVAEVEVVMHGKPILTLPTIFFTSDMLLDIAFSVEESITLLALMTIVRAEDGEGQNLGPTPTLLTLRTLGKKAVIRLL